jgi:hypothetical protein
MADFNELLAQLREHTGDEPLPASIYDELGTAYQGVVDQRDGATVQLQENATGIAQSQAEVSRLKSQNYDLVIAAQGVKPDTKPSKNDPPEGIAGLFTRRKK